MKIAVGCDHAGFVLRDAVLDFLKTRGVEVLDCGAFAEETGDDYPNIAFKVAQATAEEEVDGGVLLCGTGIGMSMAANRHQGVRAAVCTTELHARLARRHNNANVLCLGARMTGAELARAIVDAFLDTDFEGGRHQRRIDKLSC